MLWNVVNAVNVIFLAKYLYFQYIYFFIYVTTLYDALFLERRPNNERVDKTIYYQYRLSG